VPANWAAGRSPTRPLVHSLAARDLDPLQKKCARFTVLPWVTTALCLAGCTPGKRQAIAWPSPSA